MAFIKSWSIPGDADDRPTESPDNALSVNDIISADYKSAESLVVENAALEVYDWPGNYAQRFDGVDGAGGSNVDLEIWQANYGATGSESKDGDVDAEDFLLWQRNVGSDADQLDDFQAVKEYETSGTDWFIADSFSFSVERLGSSGDLVAWQNNYGAGG